MVFFVTVVMVRTHNAADYKICTNPLLFTVGRNCMWRNPISFQQAP